RRPRPSSTGPSASNRWRMADSSITGLCYKPQARLGILRRKPERKADSLIRGRSLNGLKFVHGVSFVKTTYARRRSLFLVVKPGRGGPSCHAQHDGCAGLHATQPPSANAGFTVTPSSVTVR